MEISKQKRSVSPLTNEILSNYKVSIQNLEKHPGRYAEKFALLKKVWLNGGALVEKCSKVASECVFKTLLAKTYPIVLVGEWNDISPEEKQHLRSSIEKSIANSVVESDMVLKCKYLLRILDDPWFADPVIAKILKAHPDLNADEEREFHNNEMGPIMTARLQKLCDTNCEELALNYSESCLRYIPETLPEYKQIFDMNLAMLVSLEQTNEFISKIKQLDNKSGLAFITRNGPKMPFTGSTELKALHTKAAAFAASILLSNNIKAPISNKERCVDYLTILKEWLTLHQNAENFNELVHNVLALAMSSSHLYYCSKIIDRIDKRYLAIEVHIRGITQNINEIETKKYDGDVTADQILKLEANLASHYVRLADMFHENEHVKRECYLTAFSLRPQNDVFESVRQSRIIRENENDFNANDFKSIECTHDVVDASSTVSKVYCKYCGKYRNAADEDLNKSCEILLNKENLANIPANFHDDLIILVESPRIKQLSWSMPWYELEMNCQKLMDEERKLELTSNQLVNANDQLQYIDLDYSHYIHLPEAEVPGIEKGYEQYLASSESETDDEEEFRASVVRQEQKTGDKKNVNYFESSDENDDDYRQYGQRRKAKGRSRPPSKRNNDEKRTPGSRQKFIDKSKINVPPKKRIHHSAKKKLEFDYDNPHARFYITCRKAQLDIKKQRIRLLQKRDGRFFYEFLDEAKIKKPINEELVRKNIHKLKLMTRNNKNKDKERPGRQTKGKLVFSSGTTAIVNLNGSLTGEQGTKRKRPKPVPNGGAMEVIKAENSNAEEKVKKKKPPKVEPLLDPDGQPLPPMKPKRSVKPKLGDDGQPLAKPVRRTKPKKVVVVPEVIAPIDDLSSKYEAAEILAQLGNGDAAAVMVNHQELETSTNKIRKVLTEQNGANEDRSSGDAKDDDANSQKSRGRPKGSRNKVKVDSDGNPLPKPPRKANKKRSQSDTNSVSCSETSTIRDSVSTEVSEVKEEVVTDTPVRPSIIVSTASSDAEVNPMAFYGTPIKTEAAIEIKQEEEDGMPVLELMQTTPKRKSCELESVLEESEAKKVIVEGQNGAQEAVSATKVKKQPAKKTNDEYSGLTPDQIKELRLAKRREYDRKRRERLRQEAQQASGSTTTVPKVPTVPKKRPTNAKPKSVKALTQEKSLPPALINAGRHSPSMLEVTIPTLPIDSQGKIIPTPPRAKTLPIAPSQPPAMDFESLIDFHPIVPKRVTRNSSRSNSPKPTTKNNLPSHLIQTVNYSFTAHRYNDSGGYKKRLAKFINYTKSSAVPSKTDKLSFNELRTIKETLDETWNDEQRVELEQMMARYLYEIHPCSKIKKESQIIERRNYESSVNNSKSETHKSKDLIKILIRKDYSPKNNETPAVKSEEDEFFRNERLVRSANRGETNFFLNNLVDQNTKNDINDKKNYKNRFCKVLKYNFESRDTAESEEKDLKNVKSDDEVKNYLIATVPGMTDFEFFEMPESERSAIVEIVHVKSADVSQDAKTTTEESSTSSTVSIAGTSNQSTSQQEKKETKKTPTQVTAHIQRVGHPLQINAGSVIKASTSANPDTGRPKYLLQRTIPTPSSSAASSGTQMKNQTLINVLSHQVLMPGSKTGNKITVTNGSGMAGTSSSGPVILNNFKAGQSATKIVKSFPQNWTLSPSITTNAGSSPVTVSTVSSSQANSQHLLQILNSPPNARKNLTITKDEKGNNNGVVQFICKTDGKMIHLTPINNATVLQQSSSDQNPQGQSIILNSLLKKAKDDEQDEDATAPRSVYEQNYANFIRTTPKNQPQIGQKPIQVVVSSASGTQFLQQIGPGNQLILQNNKIMAASGLPKFNQVFGKTVTMYQPGNSSAAGTNDDGGKKDLDKKQHIIVQTTSASGATQNILIHNKTGRAQILQTKGDGQPLKLLTTQATASTSNENVQPLRISVPLMPRAQQSMIGQTRIVRPIIQLAPNVMKGEQNVIVTTAPQRGGAQRFQSQNVRVENLLLQSSQSSTSTSTVTSQGQGSSSSKNVDTSTLEQLREFDMVFEQVKERSVTSVPSSPQSAPNQSPARSNQVTVINHVKAATSTVAQQQQQQQRVQEIIYTTAQGTSVLQKVNFAFLQGQQQQKPSPSLGTPLVVVTNYSQTPAISPALSVTSQLSSPTRSLSSVKSFSTKPLTQAIAAKPKTMHSPGSASSSSKTLTPKSSPLPKPIQKPQEDEQTVQRIYDILAEYAEQLRNSPDLNNKPAPRRRSNPPTNPATPSTRKKKSGKKYQGGSDVNSDYEGNFESEDSSLGPGSVSGIPSTPSMNNFSPSEPDHSLMDDQSDVSMDQHPKQSSSSQESTKDLKSSVAKQLVFSDGSESNSSNKGMVIKESNINDVIAQAGKLGNNAAVLMPGNYLLPVNLLKSGRQIAILTSANGSKILAALPGTSTNNTKNTLGSPIKEKEGEKQLLCLRTMPNNATQLILNPEKAPPVPDGNQGTAIIISSPKGKKRYLINDPELLAKLTKGGELSSADVKKLIELQENTVPTSVSLPTSSSSLSSVLHQNPGQVQTKVLQMHKQHISSNGDVELEENQSISTQYQGKIIRSDRKIVDIQRNSHNSQQAALERELRLQKSLSEECEDLGVDEPEDLFPEAGLLFDNLDPSSQEHGMGIDTPKVDKLTPIFFADEKRNKHSPQTVIMKHEDIKQEKKEFTFSNDDSNLGASTEIKTEETKSTKEDMYEFNTDEKSSDDNTDTEYNRFLHKKLGRVHNQPPMFSYKRKRSSGSSSVISPTNKKKPKTEPENTEDENDDMITILDHHSNDGGSTAGEDVEDVIDTTVVQSVGATLVVSTEKPTSPHTRRASTRGHVKKNCPCCKPKKNSHHHDPIPTPSPVMTRKLRASIGSPSGSSTHSSSSPSTSVTSEVTAETRGRGRGRNAAKATTIDFWKPLPIIVPVLHSIQAF